VGAGGAWTSAGGGGERRDHRSGFPGSSGGGGRGGYRGGEGEGGRPHREHRPHHAAGSSAAAGGGGGDKPLAGTGAALLTRRTLGERADGMRPEGVEGEYDFEAANARFQREAHPDDDRRRDGRSGGVGDGGADPADASAGGAGGGADEDVVPTFDLKVDPSLEGSGAAGGAGAYNKASSFFDSLTTDSAGTRLRRDEERK
jgi:hypothetical protein